MCWPIWGYSRGGGTFTWLFGICDAVKATRLAERQRKSSNSREPNHWVYLSPQTSTTNTLTMVSSVKLVIRIPVALLCSLQLPLPQPSPSDVCLPFRSSGQWLFSSINSPSLKNRYAHGINQMLSMFKEQVLTASSCQLSCLASGTSAISWAMRWNFYISRVFSVNRIFHLLRGQDLISTRFNRSGA